MNTPNPVAIFVAALLTVAGLVVLTANLDHPLRSHASSTSLPVTNLAPVIVSAHALPADPRADAAQDTTAFDLPPISAAAVATPLNDAGGAAVSFLQSQLTMPYYSFGRTFGSRSNKE